MTINVDLNELMMIEIGLLSMEHACRLNEKASLLENNVANADKYYDEAERYKELAKRLEEYIPHRKTKDREHNE